MQCFKNPVGSTNIQIETALIHEIVGACRWQTRPQSAMAPPPALRRGLSFSNLTFSKEFTKSGFLLVGKVRCDELRVQALEFSNHPLHDSVCCHEEER